MPLFAGDLVDFIDEHNARVLDAVQCIFDGRLLIDEFLGFFVHQDYPGLRDRDLASLHFLRQHTPEHILEINTHIIERHGSNHLHQWGGAGRDIQFDQTMFQLTGSQPLTEAFARGCSVIRLFGGFLGIFVGVFGGASPWGREEEVQHPFLGQNLCFVFHFNAAFGFHHVDGILRKVANDGFHVPSHVPNFSEFGRLDFNERSIGQPGEAAGDFCFSDPRRADHDDVVRHNFLPETGRYLEAAPAVTEGNRDRTLGRILPDDVEVQFTHDFTRRELPDGSGFRWEGHEMFRAALVAQSSSMTMFALVYMQMSAAA